MSSKLILRFIGRVCEGFFPGGVNMSIADVVGEQVNARGCVCVSTVSMSCYKVCSMWPSDSRDTKRAISAYSVLRREGIVRRAISGGIRVMLKSIEDSTAPCGVPLLGMEKGSERIDVEVLSLRM